MTALLHFSGWSVRTWLRDWRSLPPALSDQAHQRFNDAFCRGAFNVGCEADGPRRLYDDRPNLWTSDADFRRG
jgi:hypothetical protein